MLASDELKRLLQLGKQSPEAGLLIVPSPAATGTALDGSASIDLRLGRWFLAIQQSRTSLIDLGVTRLAEEFEASEGKMVYVPFGQRFVIHPGRFVLSATLEWVRVPETHGGYIAGKSTIGRRGLIIETAAGLHPGFSGCVTLELSNCGEVPIAVTPGMRICQVFVHELTRDPESKPVSPKTSFGGRRKPTFGPNKLDRLLTAMQPGSPPPEQIKLL